MMESMLRPGGKIKKEKDLCIYEMPFPLIYREVPVMDLCPESANTASLSEAREWIACL